MTTIPSASPDAVAEYTQAGWWGTDSLCDVVRRHREQNPDGVAFVDSDGDAMTWAGYDELSDRIAVALLSLMLDRGDRVVVLLGDTPLVHAAFVGVEKAGQVIMGVGHRAGDAEILHLVRKSGARAIITAPVHRDEDASALVARLRSEVPSLQHHVVVTGRSDAAAIAIPGSSTALSSPVRSSTARGAAADRRRLIDGRRIDTNELFLLNSTSGTTGLPKCVMQFQNRWFYFHKKAVEFGALTPDDVFMSVVPAPFGFGLWTGHFTPTILGSPCVIMERFSPARMIELIEEHRVSVLCCVSTQFIMMLNHPDLADHDVTSLRVMFTGGEAIPEARAREFEERTGSMVMNFYGSNETGTLSGTRTTDPAGLRLTTTGRIIPEMQVRLYSPDGPRIDGDVGRGVPACKGPATTIGYYDDDEANAKLFTEDGWMLMGDVAEIDEDGWLRVVGRTSDFIIRGGKNISAPAVEDEVSTHPAVSMAAVVPAPDPVFGERVAVFVELHEAASLTLDDLRAHLGARGVSKEWYPEYLVVVDALPRSSGGKVAKGDLKAQAAKLGE